jgi:hypothetical protein
VAVVRRLLRALAASHWCMLAGCWRPAMRACLLAWLLAAIDAAAARPPCWALLAGAWGTYSVRARSRYLALRSLQAACLLLLLRLIRLDLLAAWLLLLAKSA